MFLSQKGSLGRNPMINRVGQRLLQLFEGASAAYSLRDLASNIASVVRVRRASDNSEKDFSAADVSSGAMTQWVNGQVVPPLDVRELVDGERTGALIPAAAAYSLRNLSTSYTGNVVDVRRSSDDAENSFTAAEVADGTLTDWVTEEQVGWNVQPTWDVNAGDAIISSQSSTATTSTVSFTTTSGTSSIRQNSKPNHIVASSGDTVEINLDISGLDSNMRIRLSPSGSNVDVKTFSNISNGSNQTLSGTLTGDAGNVRFIDLAATSGATITINSIKVIGQSGFVAQWYDQSGNNNHATQGTDASQPKIVDGGSLVSGGLDFDGVNDKLSFDSSVSLSTNDFYFASVISILDGDREDITPVGNAAGNRFLISLDYDNDAAQMRANDGTFLTQQFTRTVPANETLISISTVSNTATLRCEGISAAVFNTTGESFTLGSMGQITPSAYSKHSIKELIIYTSDQSDNRTAFEANIGETYDIDLPSGVDTGYDQVDGFVETWYDQSGNGNDAVQETAGSQPKIVDAGVLVSGGLDFNGSSSAMDIDGLALESIEYFMTAVIDLDTVPSNSLRTIFDSTDATNAGAALAYANTSSQLTPFMFDGDDTSVNVFGGGANLTASKTLVGCQFKSGASESYINGGVNSTLSNTWTSAGTNTFTKSTIGYDQNTPGRSMNGKLAELIVYESDQSANRVAIEANINNQYDIY